MIINIRGTSGSGKSTLVREAMSHFGCVAWPNGFEPEGYVDPIKDPKLFIVGRYTSPCGGADTIKTQNEVAKLIHIGYQIADNVIFEGLLISVIQQRWLDFARGFPSKFIFAILNTPLYICLDRIARRREERGKATKPLNTANIEAKWNQVVAFAGRAADEGFDVRWLDYRKPLPQLLEILS
jgi:hypothetical protein